MSKSDWVSVKNKLYDLFKASFGKSIKQEYFDWRYIENVNGNLFFSVEIFNDELVASYSVFPVDLICNGEISKTAMSMTTMTHPSWRGKGLFQKLAVELYEYIKDNNIAAVWGFPNANSHSTFVDKLEWQDIYEIPTLTLHLGCVNVNQLELKIDIIRDDAFDLKYAMSPSDGFIRVNRSREYLRWRYAANPMNEYKNYVINSDGVVTSYLITKVFGNQIDLVDLQAVSPGDARALLMRVMHEGVINGVERLNCWAPTHHFIHGVLERLGFTNTTPVTYFAGRTLLPLKLPAEWLNFKKWYFQMGDSDVY